MRLFAVVPRGDVDEIRAKRSPCTLAIALILALVASPGAAARADEAIAQAGDVFNSNGGGGYGSGAGNARGRSGDDVYCQQTPDGKVIPQPYGGTRRNIPCGPNFQRNPPQDQRPPQDAEEEPQESQEEEPQDGENASQDDCTGPSPPSWCLPPNTKFGGCVDKPYDVRDDVPGASKELRYALGFERGFAGCLEEQANVRNLAIAALASKVKAIAAMLVVAVAPGVIDGVLHPPGLSTKENPYESGKDEGGRLCEWALKVSPVLLARCPARGGARGAAAACTEAEMSSGAAIAAAAVAAEGPKRFDCFPCTMAWLRGEPYTPPADGGTPWTLEEITALFKDRYREMTPQGPALPCWREGAQAKGIPGSMSPVGIETEMRLAGDGAKGVVFIVDPMSGEIGHVFGVKTVGTGKDAKVKFWDEQQQMDGALWFKPGAWIKLYRIQ